jgi:hypothetical protein
MQNFINPWEQGGEFWPPKWMEDNSINEDQQSSQNCSPKASLVSGGVNNYQDSGLKPGTLGIDVTIKVTCLKNTEKLQIIQTVLVNNDDNVSKQAAAENQVWVSPDGKKMGFTDPGGALFYYDKSELSKFAKYDGKGNGTIRFIDNPSNLSNNPYSKSEFHSYVVIVSTDGKQQILGRVVWSFKYKQADKTGVPLYIAGGLTSTDLFIIKADRAAFNQLNLQ